MISELIAASIVSFTSIEYGVLVKTSGVIEWQDNGMDRYTVYIDGVGFMDTEGTSVPFSGYQGQSIHVSGWLDDVESPRGEGILVP